MTTLVSLPRPVGRSLGAAASAGYFSITLAGIIASAGYLVWLSFQPEPLMFNHVEVHPLDYLFVPFFASFIPILCLAVSLMLLRWSTSKILSKPPETSPRSGHRGSSTPPID